MLFNYAKSHFFVIILSVCCSGIILPDRVRERRSFLSSFCEFVVLVRVINLFIGVLVYLSILPPLQIFTSKGNRPINIFISP